MVCILDDILDYREGSSKYTYVNLNKFTVYADDSDHNFITQMRSKCSVFDLNTGVIQCVIAALATLCQMHTSTYYHPRV